MRFRERPDNKPADEEARNIDKLRRPNIPLRTLLASLGFVTALSGESPAQQKDPWAGIINRTETAAPKLIKPPTQVKRSEFKTPTPPADPRGPHIPSVENEAPAETLARVIGSYERMLEPTGSMMEVLNLPTLTKDDLGEIVDELSRISGFALLVDQKKMPNHPSMKKYILDKTPKGLVVLDIPVRRSNNTVGNVQCGGERVSYGGITAIVTARHCIRYKGRVALDHREWFDHPGNADLSMKRVLPMPDEPVMEFDAREANYKGGRFAKVDAYNRFGTQTKFYTFIIPMTRPVLKILLPNLPKHEEDEMLAGSWYVSLPEESNPTPGAGPDQWNFQGESGTSLLVRTPYGYVLGPVISSGRGRPTECTNNFRKLCVSIMYVAPAKEIPEMFEAYKQIRGNVIPPRNPSKNVTAVFERTQDGSVKIEGLPKVNQIPGIAVDFKKRSP